MQGLLRLFLPTLIPSWLFFQEIGPSARIEYRLWSPSGPTSWHSAFKRPQSVPLGALFVRLFWNADWNEYLFLTTCAERLLMDPTAHSVAEINARLVHRLRLKDTRLQFRLLLMHSDGGTSVEYESTPFDVV